MEDVLSISVVFFTFVLLMKLSTAITVEGQPLIWPEFEIATIISWVALSPQLTDPVHHDRTVSAEHPLATPPSLHPRQEQLLWKLWLHQHQLPLLLLLAPHPIWSLLLQETVSFRPCHTFFCRSVTYIHICNIIVIIIIIHTDQYLLTASGLHLYYIFLHYERPPVYWSAPSCRRGQTHLDLFLYLELRSHLCTLTVQRYPPIWHLVTLHSVLYRPTFCYLQKVYFKCVSSNVCMNTLYSSSSINVYFLFLITC